ncbi:TPA: hypothetical protein JX717_002411 [Escherichia coli]|nr:hypothetical protein [Escherichia coli]
MFCRTTCNEYKFTTGQAYTILHKVFDIAYLVRGEEVMIRNEDVPYWELSDMDREHMQTLLDNGLIYRTA